MVLLSSLYKKQHLHLQLLFQSRVSRDLSQARLSTWPSEAPPSTWAGFQHLFGEVWRWPIHFNHDRASQNTSLRETGRPAAELGKVTYNNKLLAPKSN